MTTLATNRTRRVLAAAAGLFLLAAVLGAPVTGVLGSSGRDFQDPASQYERANTAITRATGQAPYNEVIALLRDPMRITARAASGHTVETVAALLASQRGFRSPPAGATTRSSLLLSRDGHETIVTATYADAPDATDAGVQQRLLAKLRAHPGDRRGRPALGAGSSGGATGAPPGCVIRRGHRPERLRLGVYRRP